MCFKGLQGPVEGMDRHGLVSRMAPVFLDKEGKHAVGDPAIEIASMASGALERIAAKHRLTLCRMLESSHRTARRFEAQVQDHRWLFDTVPFPDQT